MNLGISRQMDLSTWIYCRPWWQRDRQAPELWGIAGTLTTLIGHFLYSQQPEETGVNFCKSYPKSLLSKPLKTSLSLASTFCSDGFFSFNKYVVLILFSITVTSHGFNVLLTKATSSIGEKHSCSMWEIKLLEKLLSISLRKTLKYNWSSN